MRLSIAAVIIKIATAIVIISHSITITIRKI